MTQKLQFNDMTYRDISEHQIVQSYVMRQKILALNISIDNIPDDGAYILIWREAKICCQIFNKAYIQQYFRLSSVNIQSIFTFLLIHSFVQ